MFSIRQCKLKTITITLGPVTIILLFSFRSTLRVENNHHNPGVKSLYYYVITLPSTKYQYMIFNYTRCDEKIICYSVSPKLCSIQNNHSAGNQLLYLQHIWLHTTTPARTVCTHIQFELYLFFEIICFSRHTYTYIYLCNYVLCGLFVGCYAHIHTQHKH